MTETPQDSGFHARVHQGHVANFERKILAAETARALDQVIASLDAAVDRRMLPAESRQTLQSVAERRRRELNA